MKPIKDSRYLGSKFTGPAIPSSPQTNDVWFDSVRKKTYVYRNSKWWEVLTLVAGGEFGYQIGGRNDSFNAISTIELMTFTADSSLMTGVGNINATVLLCAGFNSSIYAYVLNQYGASTTSLISRTTFSNNPVTTITGGFITQIYPYARGLNSSLHGYSVGANTSASYGGTYIQRLVFAADSTNTTNATNLTNATQQQATVNSSNYGFSFGGNNGTLGTANTSSMEKFPFPFDSGTTTVVAIVTGKQIGRAHV